MACISPLLLHLNPDLTVCIVSIYWSKTEVILCQVQILSFLYHFIGHCEAKEKKAWLHIVPILPPTSHHGLGKQWGKENPEQSASITPPLSCKNIQGCTTQLCYNAVRIPPPRRQGGEQVGMRELSSFIHNSRAGGGTSCPACLALSLNHNLQQFISSSPPQDITLFTCFFQQL